MSDINTETLTIDPSVGVFFSEYEAALAQSFIDNINKPDFFRVNLSKIGSTGKELAKIFVQGVQGDYMINASWLFAKISQGEQKYGGIVVDGEGVDRAHQLIYLMYGDLIESLPDGLSNAAACQKYIAI